MSPLLLCWAYCRAKREGKKLVVAGCVPQADRSSYEGYSVVGVCCSVNVCV